MEASPRAHGEPHASQATLRHRLTRDESAPPLGPDQPCDLVTVPARQGLEAVDILRRTGTPAVGPVLHDDTGDTVGFFVPPGTAAAWNVPGSDCTGTNGQGLRLPATDWLLPPTDTDPVTDPAKLREALDEATRLIQAADDCH